MDEIAVTVSILDFKKCKVVSLIIVSMSVFVFGIIALLNMLKMSPFAISYLEMVL